MKTTEVQKFCTQACKKDSNWRTYRQSKVDSGEWADAS
jgi:hypothetical protein